MGPRIARPVPDRWWASGHLRTGTLRDERPGWLDREVSTPEQAVVRLQARVARHVVKQFGPDAGVKLAGRLSRPGARLVQGRLSGEYRLRPADLAAWSAHVSFPPSLAAEASPLLPAEWTPVLARLAAGGSHVDWGRFSAGLAAVLTEEVETRRSRLLTSGSMAYLAVGPLGAAGCPPDVLRRTPGDVGALTLRLQGRSHHLEFLWAPDRDDDWDEWLYLLHGMLGRLGDTPVGERVLTAALGPTRLGLLDVWEPPPGQAPVPGPVTVPADAVRSVGAAAGPTASGFPLYLLARDDLPVGGRLVVLRVAE